MVSSTHLSRLTQEHERETQNHRSMNLIIIPLTRPSLCSIQNYWSNVLVSLSGETTVFTVHWSEKLPTVDPEELDARSIEGDSTHYHFLDFVQLNPDALSSWNVGRECRKSTRLLYLDFLYLDISSQHNILLFPLHTSAWLLYYNLSATSKSASQPWQFMQRRLSHSNFLLPMCRNSTRPNDWTLRIRSHHVRPRHLSSPDT